MTNLNTKISDLERQIAALRRQTTPSCQELESEYRTAQGKADRVARVYGDSAPNWLAGESLQQYRRRLLSPYQKYSSTWRDANLAGIRDESAMTVVENSIYADALSARTSSDNYKPGELREVRETDQSGRVVSRFFGDPKAAWAPFQSQQRRVGRIVRTER